MTSQGPRILLCWVSTVLEAVPDPAPEADPRARRAGEDGPADITG